MKSIMRTLSIVIPAYNERARLGHTLSTIADASQKNLLGGLSIKEVLICDDGSTDRTASIAMEWKDKLPIRVLTLPKNRGKGAAVRTGMLEVQADFALMYDADAATPIKEVAKLIAALDRDHSAIAIGSRVSDVNALSSMSFHRRCIGRAYRFLAAGLIPGIRDAACGCKLFTIAAARHLFPLQRIDRFAFDIEILALAIRLGKRISEVPVEWTAVPESKVRLLRDGPEMLVALVRLYMTRKAARPQVA